MCACNGATKTDGAERVKKKKKKEKQKNETARPERKRGPLCTNLRRRAAEQTGRLAACERVGESATRWPNESAAALGSDKANKEKSRTSFSTPEQEAGVPLTSRVFPLGSRGAYQLPEWPADKRI